MQHSGCCKSYYWKANPNHHLCYISDLLGQKTAVFHSPILKLAVSAYHGFQCCKCVVNHICIIVEGSGASGAELQHCSRDAKWPIMVCVTTSRQHSFSGCVEDVGKAGEGWNGTREECPLDGVGLVVTLSQPANQPTNPINQSIYIPFYNTSSQSGS